MQLITSTTLIFALSIYAGIFTCTVYAQEFEQNNTLGTLGITISKDETDKFNCTAEALFQIADESKKWFTVCENLTAKDFYSAVMWKRSNYQKIDFQKSLGDTFISNRIKKAPNQNSAQINCEEDKNYVDISGMNAVKSYCKFDIANSKPLHINVLYLYPKKAAKIKVNAIVVVSSEDLQVLQTQFSAIATSISK
jgi:hypothetical protein